MIADPRNALFAGILYTIAGLCGLLRHFLLEPQTPNYPKAPPWLLGVFFCFSTVLIYFGLRFLSAFITGQVEAPPNATSQGVFLAFMLCTYKVSLLVNVLMQRYPAEVWARLNRINTMVKCSTKD